MSGSNIKALSYADRAFCLDWGSNMLYKPGYAYHIKEEYFLKAKDPKLMRNKEGGGFRPTHYCMKDKDTGLLWMIPLSSKVDKYKEHYNKAVKRYGDCLTIVLGKYDGKEVAFLLQNMFPITEEYIDHPHTRNGNPVPVHTTMQKRLLKNMKEILEIAAAGKSIVFPDIKRLEAQMLAEREASLSFKEVATGKEKKPDDY